MKKLLKKIAFVTALTLVMSQVVFVVALDIDRDDFKEWLQQEIEEEVGHELDWGDEGTSIVLTIDQKEANVDGESVLLDAAPFISQEGRTLVPIRFVSEAMDNEVGWNGETREVTINNNIVLQIDSVNAYVDGNQTTLDTAPVIVNDRTMVPIRFISEGLGYEVGWNEETREVTIVKS